MESNSISIGPSHKSQSVMQRVDIDRLCKICEKRKDLIVSANQNNTPGWVEITLNLSDKDLNGLLVFRANHKEGKWWEAISDNRFM